MKFSFNPLQGLVLLSAEVIGPSDSATLHLALDTAATATLINLPPLVALGYDPALAPGRAQVTTGSGIEYAPRLSLLKITALGRTRHDFSVLCHTLPPTTGIDGVLGLDFLRGLVLKVDFKKGRLTLS